MIYPIIENVIEKGTQSSTSKMDRAPKIECQPKYPKNRRIAIITPRVMLPRMELSGDRKDRYDCTTGSSTIIC